MGGHTCGIRCPGLRPSPGSGRVSVLLRRRWGHRHSLACGVCIFQASRQHAHLALAQTLLLPSQDPMRMVTSGPCHVASCPPRGPQLLHVCIVPVSVGGDIRIGSGTRTWASVGCSSAATPSRGLPCQAASIHTAHVTGTHFCSRVEETPLGKRTALLLAESESHAMAGAYQGQCVSEGLNCCRFQKLQNLFGCRTFWSRCCSRALTRHSRWYDAGAILGQDHLGARPHRGRRATSRQEGHLGAGGPPWGRRATSGQEGHLGAGGPLWGRRGTCFAWSAPLKKSVARPTSLGSPPCGPSHGPWAPGNEGTGTKHG